MTKIYIAALCGILVFGAYWTGSRISAEKCRAEFEQKNSNQTNQIQNEILQITGKINEETFNTATVIIRSRLRTKYTIAD